MPGRSGLSAAHISVAMFAKSLAVATNEPRFPNAHRFCSHQGLSTVLPPATRSSSALAPCAQTAAPDLAAEITRKSTLALTGGFFQLVIVPRPFLGTELSVLKQRLCGFSTRLPWRDAHAEKE